MEEKKEITEQEARKKQIAANKFISTFYSNLAATAQSGKVRSVQRALKRNRISLLGKLMPKRPFNNRKNTSERDGKESRMFKTFDKRVYEKFKRKPTEESVQ